MQARAESLPDGVGTAAVCEESGEARQHSGTPPTFVKASGKIVAVGDVHGDIRKAITALGIAGVLAEDEAQRPVWVGSDTVVVQLGDVLDRGDHEIGSVLLLRELDRQARLQGGAVYMLNGNHESLNVCGDFRYATPGGFREAALAAGVRGDALRCVETTLRARLHMYAPGQPMARELAKNPTVLMVNDTLFAHGGVLPHHVKYGLEKLNADVAAWMRGDCACDGSHAAPPYLAMGDASSVMWNRQFGREKFTTQLERRRVCQALQGTLEMLGARQLVVGHTPQLGGANCECNGRVWRIDVGMSSGVLNAVPQVLEIDNDKNGEVRVRLLTPAAPAGAVSAWAPNSAQLYPCGLC
ncbi:hypothetical protein WJX81_001017 [Elliptochloris bilobata]|uniref:Calcineurin-like phosphoesterase domain-containing protein n=1 Tax=Elliptochloris bilobata TaxID=381761 RepID=A0AAW1RNA6_9CHLO